MLLCQDAAPLFHCSMAAVGSRQLLLALSDDSEAGTGGGQCQVCPVNREMQWLLVRAAAVMVCGQQAFSHAVDAWDTLTKRTNDDGRGKRMKCRRQSSLLPCCLLDETATGLPRAAESHRKRCETY